MNYTFLLGYWISFQMFLTTTKKSRKSTQGNLLIKFWLDFCDLNMYCLRIFSCFSASHHLTGTFPLSHFNIEIKTRFFSIVLGFSVVFSATHSITTFSLISLQYWDENNIFPFTKIRCYTNHFLPLQRPKKSKLSGWQTSARKNFTDGARKSFLLQMRQKSV